MTDNEIIKALECCADEHIHSCDYCPFETECYADNFSLAKPALDLINRQKAEIERLEEQVNLWQEEAGSVGCANEWLKAYFKNAKAEAIKEFAERVKEKFSGVSLCNNGFVNSTLDNLAKEMVGADNA